MVRAGEAVLLYPELVGVALELAGAVFFACEAVQGMVREDELQDESPEFTGSLAIGAHL